MNASLKNKVVWITGSTSGIGKETAIALAGADAKVIVSGRSREKLDNTVEIIEGMGAKVCGYLCDCRKNEDIQKLVANAREKWGVIDILINNAGVAVFKKIIELDEQEWDVMLDTNTKAAFLCTKAVLPDMIERQTGHIINVVSVAGKQAYSLCGGYCASKYGLAGFTEVLRMETRKHNIKVTSFVPGATATPLWDDADVDYSKMIQPENVAQTLVALCASPADAMVEEIVIRPQGGDL